MSEHVHLGSIIIRMLADEVTPAELRKMIRALQDRPELRERCSSLGTLVDASRADRMGCFKSMVEILIGWIEPLTLNTVEPDAGAHNWPVYATKSFREQQLKGILKFSGWYGHVRRDSSTAIHPFGDMCYISEELHTIVAALEDLWGAQNIYTIQAEKRNTVDYMNDELAARGSQYRKIRK